MAQIKAVTKDVMDSINDRMDSFVSSLTGLGSRSDKARSYVIARATDLDDEDLEELYDGNAFAAKIVDKYVEEMFREGFEVVIDTEDDAEGLEMGRMVKNALYETGLVDGVREGVWGARFAGGAVLWPQVNDGSSDLAEPLNEGTMFSFEGLRTTDARYVTIEKTYDDPSEGNFGSVSHYRIQDDSHNRRGKNATAEQDVVIHESRLIVFHGYRSVSRNKQWRPGWGKSVLERVLDELMDFSSAWMAISHLIQDSAQTVAYIKGLFGFMKSASGQKTILKRMSLTNIQRSVSRLVMMDSEERFERQTHNMTDLDEIAREFGVRLSGATDMPLELLLGVKVAGIGDNGESQEKLWQNTVKAKQEQIARHLIRCIRILNKTGVVNIPEDASIDIKFNPLEQPSETEKADIRLKTAQANQIDIGSEVLLPEEAALSTYRVGGFSTEIQIDHNVRRKVLDEAIKAMEMRALEPPQEEDLNGDNTDPDQEPPPED